MVMTRCHKYIGNKRVFLCWQDTDRCSLIRSWRPARLCPRRWAIEWGREGPLLTRSWKASCWSGSTKNESFWRTARWPRPRSSSPTTWSITPQSTTTRRPTHSRLRFSPKNCATSSAPTAWTCPSSTPLARPTLSSSPPTSAWPPPTATTRCSRQGATSWCGPGAQPTWAMPCSTSSAFSTPRPCRTWSRGLCGSPRWCPPRASRRSRRPLSPPD